MAKRDVLYWVLKRGVCYLDLMGANRFERSRAFRFTTRESAVEWGRKCPSSRVVAIVRTPSGALAVNPGTRVTFRLGLQILKGVVSGVSATHVKIDGLDKSWACVGREDVLKVHPYKAVA